MRTSILALAVVSLAACSKKDASGGADAAPSVKEAAAAPLNATLVEHVKAHAEACTVSVEQGQAYSCKAGSTDAMTKYVRESKPADFASTLVALIRRKEDAKISATAVALFNEEFDYLGEDGKRANATPLVVKEALVAFNENIGEIARRAKEGVTSLTTTYKLK